MWSCDKLKAKYLLFRKAYDHQTWQDGDFGERNPPIMSSESNEHLVLFDQLKNFKLTISSSVKPMVPRFGRVVIEGEGAPSKKTHDHRFKWPHNKLKTQN